MTRYFKTLFQNWLKAFSSPKTMVIFLITMGLYIFFFKFFRIQMAVFEQRPGTLLNDFVLKNIPSINFSPITFSLTYVALFLFILTTLPSPKRFLHGMQAYTLLLIMRLITIYLIPLEPPTGMILLVDPVSHFFMPSAQEGGYIVKDLFFSGHVSAICLFCFVSANKVWKTVFLSLAIIVATFILLQHVHYTIDVVAAPFFSFLAYKVPDWLRSYPRTNQEIPIFSAASDVLAT